MLICSRKRLRQIRSDPIIKIRDHIIKRVYKKMVLGLEIDDKLQWTKHVEKQTKKISCSIAMLRKVRPYVPQATLQMMYKSFVLPYFNYCSTNSSMILWHFTRIISTRTKTHQPFRKIIWYDGNKMHAEKMLKLQKRAARVITSSGFEERSSEIFQILKWTKMQSILKKRELVMTFKALRGMVQNT